MGEFFRNYQNKQEKLSPQAPNGAWVYILRREDDPAYIWDVYATYESALKDKTERDEIVQYQVIGQTVCENGCVPDCHCQGSCHCHNPIPGVTALTKYDH